MINKIKNLIKQKRNIFITGGGGVGKSYILKNLVKWNPTIEVTSTTGISAININGQTIHSWSGIGIGQLPVIATIKKVNNNPEKKSIILKTNILAIDEVSMLDNNTFEYLDKVLQGVRGNTKPFGGLQLLLFGDFFQLPPVGIGVDGKDYCFKSKLWNKLNLEIIYLTKIYRQEDERLIEALNCIRHGDYSPEHVELFLKRNGMEPPKEAVRLFSVNSMANSYNMECLNKIQEPEYTFTRSDVLYTYWKDKQKVHIPYKDKLSKKDETLYDLFCKASKFEHELILKVGCRVMLLVNIDVEKGLVNGSCGVVTDIQSNNIMVEFDNGQTLSVKRMKDEFYQNGRLKISRKQFPLKLAYGITIHKSQGMSLDSIYVDFNRIFACGQAYVALSRVRTLNGLYLNHFDVNKIKADREVIDFYNSIEQKF